MQTNLIFLCLALGTLLYVLDLTRRSLLQARYALLWIGLWGSGGLIAVFQKDLLLWLANLTGVYAPENAFFILAILFLTWLSLHLTVMVSLHNQQNRKLAQRLAILEYELRKQYPSDE